MKVEIIAEVSTNHGGDLGLAKAFIFEAAAAGATFVKFQSYQAHRLRAGDPQRGWLESAELSNADHHVLLESCQQAHVEFLSTVFHAERVDFLEQLGVSAIKVGSGETRADGPLRARLQTFPGRVFASLGLNHNPKVRRWELLRCVSRYPAPLAYASTIACLGKQDNIVGWSDHCVGIDVACSAICAGARIIEKHVCLPNQRRPAQPWEATMEELRRLRAFADAPDPEQYAGRWGA